jgi:hypothetical protein
MMFAVLAFAAALQTSSAQAQTGGQVEAAPTVETSTAAAPTPAAPAQERLICTNQQVTGTRFPIRRCRTLAQINADRVESQEMLRRQQGSRTPPAG